MKLRVLLGVAFVGVLLTASAWAHHAAEGIISDELWSEINDRLDATDSPHLVVFDEMMVMSSDDQTGGGSMFLVSTMTIDDDDCDDYLDAIEEIFEDEELEWLHEPTDDGASTNLPVLYIEDDEACICEDDECEISFWEHIGSSGWSDDDADDIYDPPEAPKSKKVN